MPVLWIRNTSRLQLTGLNSTVRRLLAQFSHSESGETVTRTAPVNTFTTHVHFSSLQLILHVGPDCGF